MIYGTGLIPRLPHERILRETCALYGICLDDLRGPVRVVHFVSARRHAARRLLAELGASNTRIGRLLHRDRTSVRHLLRGG